MKRFFALAMVCLLLTAMTACGGTNQNSSSSGDGYVEGGDWGYIGDVMHTYWFDFTVDDAYTCTSYEGYAPPEGQQLVVVTVSLKNTFLQSLPMSQYDFQLQWGGEGDDDFQWPISAVAEDKGQLPDEYTLAINESRTGVLVYEAPAEACDFSLSFGEYFEDESEGDVYFIYFTATADSSSL